MKVIVLTRGDLAGVARGIEHKRSHSDNRCSDVSLNCKKSAEVIVPRTLFREGLNNSSFKERRKVSDVERAENCESRLSV